MDQSFASADSTQLQPELVTVLNASLTASMEKVIFLLQFRAERWKARIKVKYSGQEGDGAGAARGVDVEC